MLSRALPKVRKTKTEYTIVGQKFVKTKTDYTMAPARNSPRDENVLAPFIYIANGPGVHSPVPRAAVYGFRLRETHVSAPKLTVLQLRQGATTGMVCATDDT